MVAGSRGSSCSKFAGPVGRLGSSPASFSSSKIEDEARLPRAGDAAVGFFRKNSSVKVFMGAVDLASGLFDLPNQKIVRLWMLGITKVYEIWEETREAA